MPEAKSWEPAPSRYDRTKCQHWGSDRSRKDRRASTPNSVPAPAHARHGAREDPQRRSGSRGARNAGPVPTRKDSALPAAPGRESPSKVQKAPASASSGVAGRPTRARLCPTASRRSMKHCRASCNFDVSPGSQPFPRLRHNGPPKGSEHEQRRNHSAEEPRSSDSDGARKKGRLRQRPDSGRALHERRVCRARVAAHVATRVARRGSRIRHPQSGRLLHFRVRARVGARDPAEGRQSARLPQRVHASRQPFARVRAAATRNAFRASSTVGPTASTATSSASHDPHSFPQGTPERATEAPARRVRSLGGFRLRQSRSGLRTAATSI